MRIYPFRALRYNTAKVALDEVVTQPYDKISNEMQQSYYDESPYNLVRIILGKRFATDNEQDNAYTRAASLLQQWRDEHILLEDSEPAIYGYAQRYVVPGTHQIQERRGFICLGHLYDYDQGVIYRHEKTLAQPKVDRLSLFKTTRTYCESIYMLYSDPSFSIETLIFGNKHGEATHPPDQTVTDKYGVTHMLWKVTDDRILALIQGTMDEKKLVIADGHHRYETSVAYARERAEELGVSDPTRDRSAESTTPSFPEAAMMMTLVNMEAPGITILPTHRVVFGLKDFSLRAFLHEAQAYFSIETLSDTLPTLGTTQDQPLLAPLEEVAGTVFLMATQNGLYRLTPKPEAVAPLLADQSPRQRELDVVQLHSIVLEKLLGLTSESIRQQKNLHYFRDAADAVEMVAQKKAELAFLIKAVTLQQLHDISLSREVMPQKSTDFYPKLLSGLALYALD